MVLEAGERPLRARLELALEQDVADHPPRSGDRVERQEADARQLLTALVTVVTAEQLIAPAHGQEGGAGPGCLSQRRPERGELRCDQRLLAILAAADVEEVVLPVPNLGARAQGPHLELIAAPGGPALEHGDVAAVGVDVEVIREQMADDQRSHGQNATA